MLRAFLIFKRSWRLTTIIGITLASIRAVKRPRDGDFDWRPWCRTERPLVIRVLG
jgi:hypothetical protein